MGLTDANAEAGESRQAEPSLGLIGAGATASLFNRIVTNVAGLLATLAAVHLLSLTDYGVVAAGLSVISLGATLVVLGLGPAVVREMAASQARGSQSNVSGLVNATLTTVLVMGFVVSVVLTYVLIAMQGNVRHSTLYLLAAGLSLLLFGRSAGNIAASFFRAIGRMTMFAVMSSMTSVLQFLGVFTLLLSGLRTLQAVGVAFGLAGLLSLLTSLSFIHRSILERASRLRLAAGEAVRLVVLAGPYALAMAAQNVIGNLDVLVLSATHPSAVVGRYQPVMRITSLALNFLGPIVLAGGAPLATTLYVKHRYDDFNRLYRSTTKLLILFAGPLFIVLAGAPSAVLSVLLGDRFSSSGVIVEILLAGFAVNLLFGMNTGALIASGARKQTAYIYGGGVLVMTLLALALIPPFGAVGAATTTAVSLASLNIFVGIALNRRVGAHPFHRDILVVFLTMAIPAGLLFFYSSHDANTWHQLAVGGVLSAVWWIALFAARIVTLAELRQFLPRRPHAQGPSPEITPGAESIS